MASVAQTIANRSNAQKSTGPRTAVGKAVVAQNAVKHGLLAQRVVIKGEDPGEFELYRDRMLEDLDPMGSVEAVLAERVVHLAWRLRRAERLEKAALALLEAEQATQATAQPAAYWRPKGGTLPEGEPQADEESVLARVVVEDFGDGKLLDQLLGYERRIENSLYRTMGELRKQRLLRELTASEEVAREVSSRKCDVSSEQSQWSGTRSLAASHFALPASEEASSGVTTNGAGAEEPWGETKPICRAPDPEQAPGDRKEEEVGRGRPTYEEAPGGATTNGAPVEEMSCETKPKEVSSEERQESRPPGLRTANFTLQTGDEPPCGQT